MLTLGAKPGQSFDIAASRLRLERIEPALQSATLRLWTHPDSERGELVTVSVNGWTSVQCYFGNETRWFRVKLSTNYALRETSARLAFDAHEDLAISRVE
ncbi:MAG: hypothetical protein U5L04_01780 [Trueperaceae bacterium]|nr:hypothetical protein [Trueperaceae bacterium]